MWIFINILTFFHRRFVFIHTFFYCKIMCNCRLATCLYDIRQTSYERRFHSSLVMPPEPIWAGFAPILGNIYPQLIRAATSQQSCHSRLRRATIIYMHIFAGENGDAVTCTRTHEKIQVDFFSRRAIICTVYCWEKCKNCKVTYARGFFASIYFFIWIKYIWGNMVIGNCWKFS